jgi:hypothetical protein
MDHITKVIEYQVELDERREAKSKGE